MMEASAGGCRGVGAKCVAGALPMASAGRLPKQTGQRSQRSSRGTAPQLPKLKAVGKPLGSIAPITAKWSLASRFRSAAPIGAPLTPPCHFGQCQSGPLFLQLERSTRARTPARLAIPWCIGHPFEGTLPDLNPGRRSRLPPQCQNLAGAHAGDGARNFDHWHAAS